MKRGQMKIQQMAFVLVAIIIFFSLVLLFFFSVRTRTLEKNAVLLKEEEAKEIVKKLASSPEFYWKESCKDCVDADKLLMLKERGAYKDFWNIDYLMIEKVYPKFNEECTNFNYPNCNKITIIEKEDYGIPSSAFVSLCRWDSEGYGKCEIGRIHVAGEGIKND